MNISKFKILSQHVEIIGINLFTIMLGQQKLLGEL